MLLLGACFSPASAQTSASFLFWIPDAAVPYDITTGLGTVEGSIRVEEVIGGGGTATPVLAFSAAVRHDPLLLDPVGWEFSPALYAALPNLAAIDVFALISDTGDGMAIGLLFDLAGAPALIFPAETELVTFVYTTAPGGLAGNPYGTVTVLEFDDSMTFGNAPVGNAVWIDVPATGIAPVPPLALDGVITLTPLSLGTDFVRGDSNGDGVVQISDAVADLTFLLSIGGPAPLCLDAADANDDGQFDIADPVRVLNALFLPGAPPLPAPYPSCGPDPSPDGLIGPACGILVGCP